MCAAAAAAVLSDFWPLITERERGNRRRLIWAEPIRPSRRRTTFVYCSGRSLLRFLIVVVVSYCALYARPP